MTIIQDATPRTKPFAAGVGLAPAQGRSMFVAVVVAAFAGSLLAAAGPDAAAAAREAGDDLTRLLRLMALVKGVLALGAVSAIVWRLGVAVSPARLAAYGAAAAAMTAGPGLIWGMAHVGLGALLLHGGLLACGLLLWFDPAVAGRLEAMLRRRGLPRRRTR